MKRKIGLGILRLVLIISFFTIISCEEDKEQVNPYAKSFEIVSGNYQSAILGTELPEPIVIIVKDQNGDSFKGANVTFEITEGSLSFLESLSGKDGKVSVNWTLGATEGTQTIDVTIEDSEGNLIEGTPFSITATATSLPEATSVELYTGGNQNGYAGYQLSNPIKVRVKDQYGIPFTGSTVNFSVTEGSVSSESVITDSYGLATVTWTTGATIGTQTLTVTAFKEDETTALTGSPLTINCICTEALVATELHVWEGQQGQIGFPNQALVNPIMVHILDQNGVALTSKSTKVYYTPQQGSVPHDYLETNDAFVTQSWTLGSEMGLQTLTISAFKEDGVTHLKGSPFIIHAHACGTVTDIDGNVYKTVIINGKEWMAENLRVTKFTDGTEISLVTENTEWNTTVDPAYCWYENDETKKQYGALYNAYSVYNYDLNESRDLCPEGWQIGTYYEYNNLRNYTEETYPGLSTKVLSMPEWNWSSIIGSTGNDTSNVNLINKTGFSAMPYGSRHYEGGFGWKGHHACWWSSDTYLIRIRSDATTIETYTPGIYRTYGYYVRCFKTGK